MEQKFCVDCVHFAMDNKIPNRPDLAFCTRTRKTSLVTGQLENLSDSPFCKTQRNTILDNACGSEAVHFKGVTDV